MSADLVKVVVEVPTGSRNKYERNAETGEIELDRRIFASVTYPTEYGYVPDTTADDGDELDALVVVSEPTFPGCVIRGRAVAILRMFDEGGEEDFKLLCVPTGDPAWSHVRNVEDVPGDLCREIEHFFEVYTQLRGGHPELGGWGTRDEALEHLERARDRHRSRSA